MHDYGDVCQAINELAVEMNEPISTEDFRVLNRCLDDAIAGAVTEYGRERTQSGIEKQEMVRQLHAKPAFSDRFLTHMLTRSIRIEEDMVDQLFNSTEKRLARTLLLLARTENPRRLTAPFQSCLKMSWPRWSAQHGRGSTSS